VRSVFFCGLLPGMLGHRKAAGSRNLEFAKSRQHAVVIQRLFALFQATFLLSPTPGSEAKDSL